MTDLPATIAEALAQAKPDADGRYFVAIDHGHAETPAVLVVHPAGRTERASAELLTALRASHPAVLPPVTVEPPPIDYIAEDANRRVAGALLGLAAAMPSYPGGPAMPRLFRQREAKRPDPVKQAAAEAKRARRRARNLRRGQP